MILLLFAELILGFILYLIAKKLAKESIKIIGIRLLKQGFITLVLFNIFNISYSAGIHWKYANLNDEGFAWGSILLCVTFISVIGATFLMQLLD